MLAIALHIYHTEMTTITVFSSNSLQVCDGECVLNWRTIPSRSAVLHRPTQRHVSSSINSDTSGTNLFVVFDLIVEDDAVGSLRLLPGQGDAVSGSLLLSDHCYRRGSWKRRHRQTRSEKERPEFLHGEVQWKFSLRRCILVIVCGSC